MSLSNQFTELSDSVIEKIDELIESGLGVEHPDYSGHKVLDLRMFRVTGAQTVYNLEVLFSDKYSVEYISTEYGYDENGNYRNISDVLEASMNELCEALDVLEDFGYPKYQVLLRAVVTIDEEHYPEGHEFPDDWEVYDNSKKDDDLVIRLDQMVEVSATNRKQAKDNAIALEPSLGLEEVDEIYCGIDYWVDTDQPDNIQLIKNHGDVE